MTKTIARYLEDELANWSESPDSTRSTELNVEEIDSVETGVVSVRFGSDETRRSPC